MKKSNASILLMIGVLLFVNLLSEQHFFRLDLTEDKQYTLGSATEDIMQSLKNPITVKAYFSENLPTNIAKTRKDFEEYLIEYARLSDNNLVYEFIDPSENSENEQKAIESGVNPIMINVREKDQMKQQKAFLGAVLELEEQKEVIPFIQPGAPLEYLLSSSIKKIALTNKPSVGIIEGSGSPSLEQMLEVKQGLEVLYNLIPYQLSATDPIPDTFKTLALIKPSDTLREETLKQLDRFLERGGNLLIALNRVKGDLSTAYGSSVYTGVGEWLEEKGIIIEDDFIIDAQCASVGVQQQQGMFRFNTNVSFPYLPIINTFADHPITKGLEAMVLQFASPIKYVSNDSLKKFTPIAFTSQASGSLRAPLFFDIQKQWSDADFPLKKQSVAGVLEQTHRSGTTSRICLIGDGDFAINESQGQQLQADNVNFMVNAIDWLSDDTGLIALRTKGINYRPLDPLEDSSKMLLKYLNFLLPIILVLIYGAVRLQMNKNKRIKRMQESYE